MKNDTHIILQGFRVLSKMLQFKSIKTKLAIIIIVMLIVSGTTLIGIAAFMVSNELKASAIHILDSVSENTATKLVMSNDNAKDTVTVFALDPEVLAVLTSWNEGTLTPKEQADVSEYLINYQSTLSDIFGDVNIIDNQGIVITSTITSNIGADFSTKDYFIHQEKEAYIAAPHIGHGNVPHFTFVRPVYDDSGKQIGLVQICTSIPALSDNIFSRPGLSENGVNILVNQDGTILSGVNGDYAPFLTETFSLSIFPHNENITQGTGYYGFEEYIVRTKVSGTDWSVITTETVNAVNNPIMGLITIMIVSLLIVIVAGGIMAIFIGNSFARPIQALADTAEQLALGAVDVNITHVGSDEIGKLADAFRNILKDSNERVSYVTRIAKGDINFEIVPASDKDMEGYALIEMMRSLTYLTKQLHTLSSQVAEGNLSYRTTPHYFKGVYRELLEILNQAFDLVAIPVQETMRLSTSYSSGDYSDRFDPNLAVKGDFISFKDALNQIGINSSDVLLKIRHGVHEINAGASESSVGVEEIAAAVATLAESSSRVSSLANTNDTSLDQALTAMTDLAYTVGEVAERTNSVSQLASQSSDLAHDGVKRAEHAGEGMEEIIKSFEDTAKSVSAISSHMDEIGGIVDVITSIAEQTSLLALNAAIEAARAGDAGLGFAVVADEVKSLAQESQNSAEHIGSIIGNLQKMSVEMTDGLEKAADALQSGTNAVNETITIFHQMNEAISDVNRNMSEVAAASEEQAASVQEVTASMSEIRNMVQDTAREATASAVAAEKINVSLDQLKDTTHQSAQLSETISEEVNQFKIE